MNTIRLALVDDHQLFRAGLRKLLEQVPGFEVVMEAANGREFLDRWPIDQPDVVLLDIDMPEMDGIKTTMKIREANQSLKIIILSLHDEERFVLHLMEMGANGYLLKDTDTDELEKAIRTVMTEDHYFTDFISKILLRKATLRSQTAYQVPRHEELTEREREVLALICEGLSNIEMGEKLFLSPRTVEGHRKNMMEKLGLKNTASLVAFAIKNQLV